MNGLKLGRDGVEWRSFAFEMETFLSKTKLVGREADKALAGGALELLQQECTAEQAERVCAAMKTEEEKGCLRYLYVVLAAVTEGSARDLVMRRSDKNGFLLWKQLEERFGKTDTVSRFGAVFQFRWAEVESGEAFEMQWNRFVSCVDCLPRDSLPVDGVKSLVLSGLAQAGGEYTALRQYIQLNSFMTWQELNEKVQKYIKTELQTRMGGDDMEVHAVYGYNQNQVRCYGCGEFGHRKAECPFQQVVCRQCGQAGHIQRQCKGKGRNSKGPEWGKGYGQKGGKGDKGGGKGVVTCYRCNQPGHIARNCRQANAVEAASATAAESRHEDEAASANQVSASEEVWDLGGFQQPERGNVLMVEGARLSGGKEKAESSKESARTNVEVSAEAAIESIKNHLEFLQHTMAETTAEIAAAEVRRGVASKSRLRMESAHREMVKVMETVEESWEIWMQAGRELQEQRGRDGKEERVRGTGAEVMEIGKHKGKTFFEVSGEEGYVQWVLQRSVDGQLARFKSYLQNRKTVDMCMVSTEHPAEPRCVMAVGAGVVIRALLDSGADCHLLPGRIYEQGLMEGWAPQAIPSATVLRNASGVRMSNRGSTTINAKLGKTPVKMAFIVSDDVKQPLMSTSMLLPTCEVVLRKAGSVIRKAGTNQEVQLKRVAARDYVDLEVRRSVGVEVQRDVCNRSEIAHGQVERVTTEGLKRQIEELAYDLRRLREGPVERADEPPRPMGQEELNAHIRGGHAEYTESCERCVRHRGRTNRKKGPSDALRPVEVFFDYGVIGTQGGVAWMPRPWEQRSQACKATILIGAGPGGEVFAAEVDQKGARCAEVSEFGMHMARRHRREGDEMRLILRGDNEPALQKTLRIMQSEMIRKGVRCELEPVRTETPWANGRAEVRVRSIKEMLSIYCEEIKEKLGAILSVRSTLMRFVVRHSAWVINHVRRCQVSGLGMRVTTYEACTGKASRWETWTLFERILYKVKSQVRGGGKPRMEQGWYLGTQANGDGIVLTGDGKISTSSELRAGVTGSGNQEELRRAVVAAGTNRPVWECTCGQRVHEASCEAGRTDQQSELLWPVEETKARWEQVRVVGGPAESGEPARGDTGSGGRRGEETVEPTAAAVGEPEEKRGEGDRGAMKSEEERPAKTARISEVQAEKCSASMWAQVAEVVQSGVKEAAEITHEEEISQESIHDRPKAVGQNEAEAKEMEIRGLRERGVFEEVPWEQVTSTPISSRWVVSPKDGGVKARLVARGFQEPKDGAPTFAATTAISSCRLVLACAAESLGAQVPWTVKVADVSQAFLYADLDGGRSGKETFLVPPAEAKCAGVWLLKKALYGLRTAPLAWQKEISRTMAELGWTENALDCCLFTGTRGGLVSIHVDDLLIGGEPEEVDELLAGLTARYRMTVKTVGTEDGMEYLGRVIRRCAGGFVFGVGPAYVDRAVRELGITGKRRTLQWPRKGDGEEEELSDEKQSEYRQMLGKLAWLDRCDLRSSVVKASERLGHATQQDWDALVGVWEYVSATRNRVQSVRPILVPGVGVEPPGSVAVHTDADYAGCPDTRRSVSGYVIWGMIGRHWYLLEHGSRKQSVVSHSSGESELTALVGGVAGATGLRQVMAACGKGDGGATMTICTDSAAAYGIALKRGASRRTRHIEVKCFYVQGILRLDGNRLLKIPTGDMAADMLTKVSNWSWRLLEACGLMCLEDGLAESNEKEGV